MLWQAAAKACSGFIPAALAGQSGLTLLEESTRSQSRRRRRDGPPPGFADAPRRPGRAEGIKLDVRSVGRRAENGRA